MLFLGTLLISALHAFSIYALWNMYLVGVDLAIGLSVIGVFGGLLTGSLLGVLVPIGFIAYLLWVRDHYLS